MIQNRINIDGVWYVREESTPLVEKPHDPTHYEGLVWETDKYCFDVTRIFRDETMYSPYEGVDVKFTDKRNPNREAWIEDRWDSNEWMVELLLEDIHAIESAKESMCNEGVAYFSAVVEELIRLGWIKTSKY